LILARLPNFSVFKESSRRTADASFLPDDKIFTRSAKVRRIKPLNPPFSHSLCLP